MTITNRTNADELTVLPYKTGEQLPADMMRAYLLEQAEKSWQRWKRKYEKLKTSKQIAEYQKNLREKFVEVLGGFPERTPLNPRITGVVQRNGYKVELTIFESQPKHYVTALLFLPDANQYKPPHPAVLVPCGHFIEAKGWQEYQSIGALLALNGMAALVFDPIEQGERIQLPEVSPKLWGVEAHNMVGAGSILLGRNTATFEIWDGIRAIDYLQSHPKINPNCIGCTGNSGGGLQTSYLLALDDRIKAAAPSCYHHIKLTHIRARRGDSENHIYGQLKFGWEPADYLMMRAPVPVLMCAATKDFLPIDDVWEIFRYAKRLYTRMGFSERIAILENGAGHNYNKTQREAIAKWMSMWLRKRLDIIKEPEIKLLTPTEYTCTPAGQVMLLDGALSTYDLNIDYEKELLVKRKQLWFSKKRANLLALVRELTGIRRIDELPEPNVEQKDVIQRPCYDIEKAILKPEPGIYLPALIFKPTEIKAEQLILYIHEKGKSQDAALGGPIEKLVRNGSMVLTVDLRGTGETAPPAPKGSTPASSVDYPNIIAAYLLGRSYVGMRAEDILYCARYAASIAPDLKENIKLVAFGNVGVPALHAAALEPALFSSVKLTRMLVSWSNVIHSGQTSNQWPNMVHGALKVYDLPDLANTLGEKLTIEEPLDAMQNPIHNGIHKQR